MRASNEKQVEKNMKNKCFFQNRETTNEKEEKKDTAQKTENQMKRNA